MTTENIHKRLAYTANINLRYFWFNFLFPQHFHSYFSKLSLTTFIQHKDIVDKTASFVARNGPEFESRIRQNELGNPKFNFLSGGDPYHAYYQHKVNEIREGRGELNGIQIESNRNIE